MSPLLPGLKLLFFTKNASFRIFYIRWKNGIMFFIGVVIGSRVEENDEQKTRETEKRKDQDL